MKNLFFSAALLLLGLSSIAQENKTVTKSRPLNAFSINILGNGSLLSVNYEVVHFIQPSFFITGKLGVGYNEEFQLCIFGPCSSPPSNFATIPHHFTGNLGKGRHFFEFGFGGTLISGNTSEHYLLYPIIGYRLQPLQPLKANFRLFGHIPFSGLETEDILFSPLGLSLGLCF